MLEATVSVACESVKGVSERLHGILFSNQTKRITAMKTVRSLSYKLKPLLGWHQSRIECLAHIIINIITAGSVNLACLADQMSGQAKIPSHHKRLKRFFRDTDINFDQVANLIVGWLAPEKDWVLCIDRTNWKLGKRFYNILMLGVELKGVAIPVMWVLLPAQGNSSTFQRIQLLSRFIKLFGSDRVAYLAADREFKGGDWLKWLKKQGIHWRIRIANNTLMSNRHQNRRLHATRLFSIKVGESLTLNQPRNVWGMDVFVSAHRSAQEHIIVISDEPCETILQDYMRRWAIETLFQCYKGRGFNLEDTRLTDPEKVSRLLAVMALTLCWCYDTGDWRHEKEPIKILKHGRAAFSVFRYGFSLLKTTLANPVEKSRQLGFFIRKFCVLGDEDWLKPRPEPLVVTG